MKKVISVVLALLMLSSCFSAFTAGALDGSDIADAIYTEESINASATALMNLEIKNLPDNFTCDIRELESWTDGDDKNDVSLLGMDLDYLYNGAGSFNWGLLDVYTTDAMGNKVMKITVDDISTAFTNLNVYLQKLFYNYCGGIDFYNVENAVAIINFIGPMLKSDFVKLNAVSQKNLFNNKVPSSNDFFNTVSKLSGLGEIIGYNWIGKERNFYKPVVDILGGAYVEFYDDYYADGVKLGAKIIEGAFSKIKTVGPIEYILDILKIYCTASYSITYREPTLALFTLKKNLYQEHIPSSKFNTFDGLLKLVFCNCNPVAKTGCFGDKKNITHFCPIEFPTSRFASAADNTERTLYLYYYLNLCGAYGDNKDIVNNWKDAIGRSIYLGNTDKTRVKYLLDGFFLGNFDETINNTIVPLYKENISTAPDGIFQRFKNTIMNLLKKVADYFDYLRRIFSGELDYGQGNSPFN